MINANIKGLLVMDSTVTSDPVSQSIIDSDYLSIRAVDPKDNFELSLADQNVGTLFTRLSMLPALYSNKDQINELLIDCPWVSVAPS